ncbi:MAG: T9SS type A sorting domain-containing protein [Bacteroidales bacterium]|jgi:hypothetical protein|nr:T9SS type A sorting domain-containing protein [Bacteroidales bacterium]
MKNVTFILSMLLSIAGFAQSYPMSDSTANTKAYILDSTIINYPLKDYDDDTSSYSFLVSKNATTFSLNIDKDIDEISKTPYQGTNRLNDKFYTIGRYSHQVVTYLGYRLLDSIEFIRRDGSDTSSMIRKKIFDKDEDTTLWAGDLFNNHFSILSNNNLLIVSWALPNDTPPFYDEAPALKLTLLDTLGNIVNERIWQEYMIDYDVCEVADYIVLNKVCRTGGYLETEDSVHFYVVDPSGIYFFNKNTLELEDSILTRNNSYIKKLNNYEFISFGIMTGIMQYTIVDSRTKTEVFSIIDTIEGGKYPPMASGYKTNLSTKGIKGDYIMNFIREDSAYVVYECDYETPYSVIQDGTFDIVNFNAREGKMNFTYRIPPLEDPSIMWLISVVGIVATSDGGAIVAVNGIANNGNDKSWLVKVMPNGFVGITNVIGDDITIIAYPNPASDNINFSCSEVIKGIEIFNLLGQQVYAAKVNDKFTTINVSNFAKGNYVAKLRTDKGVTTKKFVVE